MRAMKTARFISTALAVLACAGVASAQTKTETQIGGWNVEGYVEPGLRFFGENPNGEHTPGKADAKFEEYRDINQGLFLEGLRLRLFRPDESYSFQISGKDWGLHTQEFHLLGERLGQWQAGFDWDQMRHIYSTNAQTLLKQFGGNVFILPGTRPALSDWNSAPPWGCSDSATGTNQECNGQIAQQWYTGRVFFKLSPTPNVDVSAELSRIYKNGQRPMGMAFSDNEGLFLELVEPIDQTTYEFRTKGTWATEMFQLKWGYTGSVFVNGFRWVRADNPCNPLPIVVGACPPVADQGQFGTTSLPPNNQAHTFTLGAGANLPLRTRVNASFTYQFRYQNQDFQQPTYSNSLVLTDPGLGLPEKSLRGNVQTAVFNFDVTSRPLQAPVTFTLKYRLNDRMDYSSTPTFPLFIFNDQNAVSDLITNLRAGRYDYRRQNASLDGRYQINSFTALTLGAGWEGWNRNQNWEVTQTNEATAKAALDVTPTDWLLVRATYLPSFRRGNFYNALAYWEQNAGFAPGTPNQSYQLRKYNEADRNRQRADLMVQITPTDQLSFTPTASYKYDDYIASGLQHNGNTLNREQLGLQQVASWSAGMDVNWAPSDRLSFAAGYVHESNFQKQRNTLRDPLDDPSLDWISNSTDTVDTFHASLKATLIPDKLDFLLKGTYAYALGRVQQYSPNATGSTVYSDNQPTDIAFRWPAFEDTYSRLDAALQYHLSKSLTAKLFYAYESFTKHNWQTDTLTPTLTNVPAVFLGQDWKNYWAQIVGVTLKYKLE